MTVSGPDAGRMHPRRGERGSATVLTLVMVGLLTALALGGSVAGGLVVAQRRAAAAADLAALAGAAAAASNGLTAAGAGCDRAADLAAGNGAELTFCSVEGREVVVRVVVDVASPWGGSWEVPAVARAGPAEATAADGSGP